MRLRTARPGPDTSTVKLWSFSPVFKSQMAMEPLSVPAANKLLSELKVTPLLLSLLPWPSRSNVILPLAVSHRVVMVPAPEASYWPFGL